MPGASVSHVSTSGVNTNGSASAGSTVRFISLSTWRVIGSEQCAHSVSTVIETGSSLNRPCTKGVAMTSAAQAA